MDKTYFTRLTYFNFIPFFFSCILDMLRNCEEDTNGYANQFIWFLLSFTIFKRFLFILCMWMFYLNVCTCIKSMPVPVVIKRALNPSELQAVVWTSMWVITTEHGSSVRTANTLNYWAFSSVHALLLLMVCFQKVLHFWLRNRMYETTIYYIVK